MLLPARRALKGAEETLRVSIEFEEEDRMSLAQGSRIPFLRSYSKTTLAEQFADSELYKGPTKCVLSSSWRFVVLLIENVSSSEVLVEHTP